MHPSLPIFNSRVVKKMSDLSPTELQLCHRLAADAYACKLELPAFCDAVLNDERAIELDIATRGTILDRACQLRDFWTTTGVGQPIKQNFLDELPKPIFSIQVEENSMYSFQSRFPIDHVLKLVANLRSGEFDRGDNLMLVGAITGEIGALLKSGFTVGVMSDEELPSTIDGCIAALGKLEAHVAEADAAFDPTILIPIILKLIELWIAKRSKQ